MQSELSTVPLTCCDVYLLYVTSENVPASGIICLNAEGGQVVWQSLIYGYQSGSVVGEPELHISRVNEDDLHV